MTTKCVCAGAFVTDNHKSGVVISVDQKAKVAVIMNEQRVWTDKVRNLQVTSYQGVE